MWEYQVSERELEYREKEKQIALICVQEKKVKYFCGTQFLLLMFGVKDAWIVWEDTICSYEVTFTNYDEIRYKGTK